MKEAIKIAIKGGYIIKDIILKDGELFAFAKFETQDVYNKALLDVNFWQCLGNELGWPEVIYQRKSRKGNWKYNWHQFIDHLIAQKPIDDFFTNLTSPQGKKI